MAITALPSHAICWLLSLCALATISFSSPIWAQTELQDSRQGHENPLDGIDRYIRSVEDLRTQLDRSQIDSEDLLDKLDYDETQIIEYVKNEIYFEQYKGALRGSEGTIRSTSGNALDQSILLAKLLRDAGYDARIARGTITAAQAEILLTGMNASRKHRSPYANNAAFNNILRKMWLQSGQSSEELASLTTRMNGSLTASDSGLDGIAEQETNFILQTLKSSNVPLGDADGYTRLIEEARDYYWVEYRSGSADGWVAVHPAIGELKLNLSSTQSVQFMTDSVPVELQHRFRFEVMLETESGGKLHTKQILKLWERPTANLVDRPLTFTVIPLSLTNQLDKDQIDVPTDGNEVFIPMFQGHYGDETFDLLGNVIPLDAALSNYAALFATDAKKLSGAASSLSALGNKSPDNNKTGVRLNALKFRFVFVQPGGKETEYWRSVLLRSGSDGGDQLEMMQRLYSQLMTIYSFQLAMGNSNPAASIDASLASIVRKKALLKQSIAQLLGIEYKATANDKGNDDVAWIGLAPTYTIFDSFDTVTGAHTYRPVPSLLVHKISIPLHGQISESTDIVQNKRRLRSAKSNYSPDGLRLMISMGVWESVTEGSLLGGPAIGRRNTHTAFDQYRNDGLDFDIVGPADFDRIAEMRISDRSKTVLRRELQRGYAVLLPSKDPLPESEHLFWWRIDTQTGETLGVSATGAGLDLTQYTLFQRVVAGGVIGALVGITCDEARRNVLRDTSLTVSDCITLGLGMGFGAAGGSSVFEGVPTGLALAVGLLVFQKYIAPYTDAID
jgi:hypothetical protein